MNQSVGYEIQALMLPVVECTHNEVVLQGKIIDIFLLFCICKVYVPLVQLVCPPEVKLIKSNEIIGVRCRTVLGILLNQEVHVAHVHIYYCVA